jgi:phospholipase C
MCKHLNKNGLDSKPIGMALNSKESRFAGDPKNAGGGPMSKFTAWSDNPGLVTSYLNTRDLPEGRLARKYVLCDNAFHSAFGGSFLNHIWLIAARSPIWPAHPSEGGSPKPANATSNRVVALWT